jgi:hypothetical protein
MDSKGWQVLKNGFKVLKIPGESERNMAVFAFEERSEPFKLSAFDRLMEGKA